MNGDPNDVGEVLREAIADAGAGRHAQALTKHVWFHRNALLYEPSIHSVRSSYALSAWIELATVYPPARDELDDLRLTTANARARSD